MQLAKKKDFIGGKNISRIFLETLPKSRIDQLKKSTNRKAAGLDVMFSEEGKIRKFNDILL